MKIALPILLITMCLCHRPAYAKLVPYDPVNMNYETTPAQAVSTIQTWTGNPSLSLTLAGVNYIPGNPGYEEYIYRSLDHQTFRVKCHTGWLWRWTNSIEYNIYKTMNQQSQSSPLPQSQLEQAALAFARTHYPNFDALKMQELSYDDGQVTFYSQPVPGVWFEGNFCSIDIDSYTGHAWRYVAGATSSGITVPTTASLSSSQAETIALNWLMAPVPPGDPASTSDPVLSAFTTQVSQLWVVNDNLGQQRLVWRVYAATSTTESNYTYSQWVQNDYDLAASCEVGIDANTGEVATYQEWLGGKEPTVSRLRVWHSRTAPRSNHKRRSKSPKDAEGVKATGAHLNFQMDGTETSLAYPPVQINGKPYFYAKYLSFGTSESKMTILQHKKVAINGPARKVSFDVNSRAYQVNGKIRQMSALPVLVNSRCYVPLDVMNAVLPGKFTYDAKTKTVRYDPPQKKQASK